jgi:hypothetical protein
MASFRHRLLGVQTDGKGLFFLRHVQQHECTIESQDQLLIVRKQVDGAVESSTVEFELAIECMSFHPFHSN